MEPMARRLQVSAAPAELQDWFEAQGFTDGLPVVPPTPELVAAMVEGSGLPAGEPVAPIAPKGAVASVEKVAINAVMAGCRPQYMPVIVAALKALAQPAFNLAGVQGTTHPCAPLVFVNGPVRERIALNCGSNVFGQGFRANATIGRAIRLVLINIGQGLPGRTDMATFGSPCKFSWCAGENEERSPWAPFHVEHGMTTIASTMATLGNNNVGMCGEMMLVLGPEHARILADHGMSKDDIRLELHRRMRLRFDSMGVALRNWYRNRRPAIDVGPEVEEIPYLDDPSQILILVAGGPGLHSIVVPSFGGMSKSTRERVVLPA
jgi:hypothetical protein